MMIKLGVGEMECIPVSYVAIICMRAWCNVLQLAGNLATPHLSIVKPSLAISHFIFNDERIREVKFKQQDLKFHRKCHII